MSETHEIRLKRLAMRSMRRGIKEMDIILMRFCDARLHQMDAASLDIYEELLAENDQDLYQWVSGQKPAPEAFLAIVAEIRKICVPG